MHNLRSVLAGSLLALNRLLSSERSLGHMHQMCALVFAPHPDDEVLGCGGAIALKVDAGAQVKVIVMTDGRASHNALISGDELVGIRHNEAKEAAQRLGLTSEDYIFLDFEDHQLANHRQAATVSVTELIKQFRPDEIYVPHRRDGLIDHVETNGIVRAAVNRIGKPVILIEYPVWLWNTWPWTPALMQGTSGRARYWVRTIRNNVDLVFGCRSRIDVASVRERKLRALAAYESQLQRRNGDPRWPVLADVADGEFLRCFESNVELFRRTDYGAGYR